MPTTDSLPHFFALMLSDMAKVNVQVVGYRGSAPLLNDLLDGQIPIAFDTLDSLLPQHDAGKLRILATSAAKRSPLAPNRPTFKEQGLPISAVGWNTFFAPATTPKAVVDLTGKTVFQSMSEPATQAKFASAKMAPVAMNQAQTATAFKAFNAQWKPVIERSGFKPEA